jgi:DNA-binding transcriptional ArsR family regulator
VLERAALLKRRRDGRIHRCSLNPEPMQEAERWIEEYRRFWEASLGRLSRYLDKTTGTKKEKE